MPILRAEVHKAAVGLENLASSWHELANAADLLVSAQRKLSKALKDSATSKGCPEIAKLAFTAGAHTIDIASEVDTKYAHNISREYEVVSATLRKWFKALSREEREHDEFVSVRENKIRIAGEAYERRALKRDVAEEYTRYVELLNTLGAEITAAQRKHTVEINDKHRQTMISSGACLARLVNATWVRSCDTVRRCAPGIGRVHEAQVWCESGWNAEPPGESEPHKHERFSDSAMHPNLNSVFRPPSYRSDSQASPGGQTFLDSSSPHGAPHNSSPEATPRLLHLSTDTDDFTEYYSSTAADTPLIHGSAHSVSTLTGIDATNASSRALPVPPPAQGSPQSSLPSRRLVHNSQYLRPSPADGENGSGGHSDHDYREPSRSTSPIPVLNTPRRTYTGQAGSLSSPHLPIQRVTSSPVTYLRPYTPSDRPKSSWVGKGLRRLSMPIFHPQRFDIPSASPSGGPQLSTS